LEATTIRTLRSQVFRVPTRSVLCEET
jgi:hypothetical protein